jgi:D-xylose reductase
MWKVPSSEVQPLIEEAVSCGYRHFDCACDYGNEKAVGDALQRELQAGNLSRDDLWVTSKLWNTYHAAEHVRPALERSLEDLQLDYLDLYLMHFPIALQYVPFEQRYPPEWLFDPNAAAPRMQLVSVPLSETWHAMEELVTGGLVRNIGVCNFNCALLRDLLSHATIRPAVLQVELHPYLTQSALLRYCQAEGIAVTAFSPLGAGSYVPLNMASSAESVLTEEVVVEIARRHQRTPAQVVLRWGIQRGTSVIPKTVRPERLRENLALFDFALETDEMEAIANLNRNRRFNDPGVFCEAAFGTFCPIYD